MNPFVYPKAKHRRKERPPHFGDDYRAYKPHLRGEFARKCVYCLMPDTANGGASNYGVDHYKPKSKFPALATTYSNLYHCCNACNRRKGSYWPAQEKRNVLFIPNPCDHVMAKHLKFERDHVRSMTPAGRQALLLLDLDDPEAVQARALITDAIDAFREKRTAFVAARGKLRRRSGAGTDAAIQRLDDGIARIDQHLDRLTGRA